jgi:hypothetical protein
MNASRRAASFSGVWLRRTFTISAAASWSHRSLSGLKSGNGGLQLHAIVGGGRLPTSQLAHVIAISKQRSPTARSGVSITSAISVDRYLLPPATFCHAKKLCFSFQSVEEFRIGASASKWKL